MRKYIGPCILAVTAACSGALFADTLTLKNGDSVEGTYLGGTARVLRMEVNGRVQTYDISMVTGLSFSNAPEPRASAPSPASTPPAASAPPPPIASAPQPTSGSSSSDRPVLRRAPNSSGDTASASPPAPANNDPDRPVIRRAPQDTPSSGPPPNNNGPDPYASAPMPNPPQQPAPVELPAGTRITVRMIDSVDSQVARVGDTFRAAVDEPVSMNGVTVIPRGADVVAKLVEEDQSGKLSGRTSLKLVLSTVRVNDRNVDVVTSDVVKESSSRTARSAGVIGGGAVLGAIIGAAAGGGKGAAIGAGSGAAVGTGAEVIGKGQRVKVPSETRLDFTLSYSVRI